MIKIDNIICDRAYYAKLDMYSIILCNKDYKLACAHITYCAKCSKYTLKNSAMLCPYNNKGNYKDYKKDTEKLKKSCKC